MDLSEINALTRLITKFVNTFPAHGQGKKGDNLYRLSPDLHYGRLTY